MESDSGPNLGASCEFPENPLRVNRDEDSQRAITAVLEAGEPAARWFEATVGIALGEG